jgi:hypothetical protein
MKRTPICKKLQCSQENHYLPDKTTSVWISEEGTCSLYDVPEVLSCLSMAETSNPRGGQRVPLDIFIKGVMGLKGHVCI